MKTVLSILIVALSGLLGLSLVYTDWLPIPLGPARVAVGGAFYVMVGYFLARWNAGGRPMRWALASAWALFLFGILGVWISATAPASSAWSLALVCLFGPLAAAGAGGWIGQRAAT